MPVTNVEKKTSKKKKIMIAIGIIILFFIGLMALGGNDKSAVSVKADDMLNEYINDQAAADKKYKGKTIKLNGQVIYKKQFSNANDYYAMLAQKKMAGKEYSILIAIPADKIELANKIEEGKFVSVEEKGVGIVAQKDPNDISIQIMAEKVNQ